jgi:hypothetical protein
VEHDRDYEAIIDGGLGQESIEASSPIHGDQREAQHCEYTAHHYSIYTSDLITEVLDLEALGLHLIRVSLYKARDHLYLGREVVNRLGALWVVHSWRSSNGTDKIRGNMDLRASDPSEKRIANSPVDVRIELPHQLCYGWTVILYHLSPTLGL